MEVADRLEKLGYAPEIVARFFSDPHREMLKKVMRELETKPLQSVSQSPLRAVTLYRGAMIFPSEYSPINWKRTIFTHDYDQSRYWATTNLKEAEHYGKPTGWSEWMGSEHPLRGIVLKLQIPKEEISDTFGSKTAVKIPTFLREERYVTHVETWEFSTAYTKENASAAIWYKFDDVYDPEHGFDERKMLDLKARGLNADMSLNLFQRCSSLLKQLIASLG